jgi:hypothetical protein
VDPERELLRHVLATLAYRTQKALRGAPATFGDYSAGNRVRTPRELVRHMASLMGHACTFFEGGTYRPAPLATLADEVARFHEQLARLGRHLADGAPLRDITIEQLLRGPLADGRHDAR